MSNRVIKNLLVITVGVMFLAQNAHSVSGNSGKLVTGERDYAGIKIVCSFSQFASIAEFIVQDKGEVHYISQGDQDPHFVPPKPSFAMLLNGADMWVTTGLDLEIWSTTLLDKARNRQILDGEIGFVSASDGVRMLQVTEIVSRTEGDVHPMGNPHIHTGPLNWKVIATNIAIGLNKIDPENGDFYNQRRDEFINKVDIAVFGEELVGLLGGAALSKLVENNTIMKFLEEEYQGEKLKTKLGGWLKKALPFRGKKIMAYHKNWAYFAETFGLEIVGYIEPKPGIPPSARHVQDMIKLIEDQNISIMIVASHFERNSPRKIEEKTGVKAIFLPLAVHGVPEVTDTFKMIDYWIDAINANIK